MFNLLQILEHESFEREYENKKKFWKTLPKSMCLVYFILDPSKLGRYKYEVPKEYRSLFSFQKAIKFEYEPIYVGITDDFKYRAKSHSRIAGHINKKLANRLRKISKSGIKPKMRALFEGKRGVVAEMEYLLTERIIGRDNSTGDRKVGPLLNLVPGGDMPFPTIEQRSLGGKMCHMLHPNMASNNCLKIRKKYPDLARNNMIKLMATWTKEEKSKRSRKSITKTNKKYPDMARIAALKSHVVRKEKYLRMLEKSGILSIKENVLNWNRIGVKCNIIAQKLNKMGFRRFDKEWKVCAVLGLIKIFEEINSNPTVLDV